MDRFREIGLNVAVDLVRGGMRNDNRADLAAGRRPRFGEKEIEAVGRTLYRLTQVAGIALVDRREYLKARALKDGLKGFLEDHEDDYGNHTNYTKE